MTELGGTAFGVWQLDKGADPEEYIQAWAMYQILFIPAKFLLLWFHCYSSPFWMCYCSPFVRLQIQVSVLGTMYPLNSNQGNKPYWSWYTYKCSSGSQTLWRLAACSRTAEMFECIFRRLLNSQAVLSASNVNDARLQNQDRHIDYYCNFMHMMLLWPSLYDICQGLGT